MLKPRSDASPLMHWYSSGVKRTCELVPPRGEGQRSRDGADCWLADTWCPFPGHIRLTVVGRADLECVAAQKRKTVIIFYLMVWMVAQ